MPDRAGEHDLVAEERLERHAAMTASRADDAELERAFGDLVDERLGVRDRQPDADVRELLLELAQQQRHDRSTRPGGGADLERARDRTLIIGVELLEQMLLEREQ